MVASGGVVALVPESAEMGAADPTRPEFIMAWVDNICAEDGQEERTQWYGMLHQAGYRSKRRLRSMSDSEELVELGIPSVVARWMVEQAHRMHGYVS